jgi:glycerol-3-phosphate acyltransferase PlsY
MNPWIAALAGYAIGSLPIGYLLAQASGIDLRREGSGNVGATNVYRTAGRALAIVVMIADMAKGSASVLLAGPGVNGVLAGVGAVAGHIYPVWLGFRGGKGVATAAGVFGLLSPWPAVLAAVSFVIAVWRSRIVSLGSVIATIVLPIAEWLSPGRRSVDYAATGVAALILFRHRGNIMRLWSQTERALGA